MVFRAFLISIPLFLLADTLPLYTLQTIAGTYYVGDGGFATAAILSQPEGIAVDPKGNLFVADADDNRIRQVAPGGIIQTVAGTGHAGFSGDGGPAIAAQVNQPYGVALDAAGNLYVADLGNARVRKIAITGGISTIAGGGTQAVSSAAAGLAATSAVFSAPRNIAFDLSGNMYISDFGANQVYLVLPSGSISVFAGSGKAGYSGDGGAAQTAELSAPAGLACDSAGNLYIADSGNGRVRLVTNGVISTTFSITAPTGLSINGAGTLYIAAAGYFGTTTMSLGSGLIARDVATDAMGNIYVTAGSQVREFAVNGAITVIAGNGAARYYGGDGGPANMARLHNPSGIVLDDLGNAYITDTANNRIREVLSNGTMTTFAGTGDAGNSDGGGVAMLAQFKAPVGLALDSLRNVYVADTGNNRVCKIAPSGVFTVVATQLNAPQGVAVDGGGNVYITDTDNNQVLMLREDGTFTVAAQALKPAGIVIDPSGTLFISETDRVSKIPSGGARTTILDGLNDPAGIAVTSTGDLVVAETGNDSVLLIPLGVAIPVAETIQIVGFPGSGAFDAPAGVALDSKGNIWVADSGNQRIVLLTPAGPSTEVLSPVSVVNAASLASGPIAPGEIISIFGSGFDPTATQVVFRGQTAILSYTGATQINALVPALIPGASSEMTVIVDGVAVAATQVTVLAAVPGLFESDASTGQVAALNQDGSANSAAHPALRGSYVSLFATGWSDTTLAVTVAIGGYDATVQYAGPAPGFAGLMQINVQVPAGFLGPGTQTVLLTVGNAQSQAGATIALQ